MASPKIEKTVWRQEMGRRLARLDPAQAARSATALIERLLQLPSITQAEGVFLCLSFGAEIDTRELARRWAAEGRRVYVPRTVRRGRRLEVVPFPCRLERTSFGLEQPPAEVPALADEAIDGAVDVALILGLAFDPQGVRLGYGAGYFDRFLAGRPFPSIGLAHDFQIVDALPSEPHDIPMQLVVSERRALEPKDRGPGDRGPG